MQSCYRLPQIGMSERGEYMSERHQIEPDRCNGHKIYQAILIWQYIIYAKVFLLVNGEWSLVKYFVMLMEFGVQINIRENFKRFQKQ